jgi:DnaJ-class molecular chaperone
MRYRECRTCGGTGNYMGRICPACDGKGVAIIDISEDY